MEDLKSVIPVMTKAEEQSRTCEWSVILDSIFAESGDENRLCFRVEAPQEEGPYVYDRLENAWISLPERPFLPPYQREAIIEAAEKLRRKLPYPFSLRLLFSGGTLYLSRCEKKASLFSESTKGLWKAVPGSGRLSGCPFKVSLFAASRGKSLARFILESRLLKEKQLPGPPARVIFGRAYDNLELSAAVLNRLPYFTKKAFAEYYGLKSEETVTKSKRFFLLKRTQQLKFKLAEKLALPAAAYRDESIAETWDRAEALYEKALKETLHPQKLAVLWYQLCHAEFAEAEGSRARQDLILAGRYLQYRKKHPDAGPENLPALKEHPEIKAFRRLWTVSRALRADKTLKRGALLSRYFPETAFDRRYREKLSLDLDFLLTADDDALPAALRHEGPEVSGEHEASASEEEALYQALSRREALAARSRRFYRLILRYSEKMAGILTEDGVLSRAEDLCYADYDLLSAYVAERLDAASLREAVSRRRRYFLGCRGYQSPDILGLPAEAARPPEGRKRIEGFAASAGEAEGRLSLCRAGEVPENFRPGDILLCRMSDSSLSSRLLLAGGILTIEGGVFSHAALLARAAGIPCVTGLEAALERFREGSRVHVNGKLGFAEKIGESDDAS